MTIRLLAQYQGNPPNTIVTLAGGVETALVAAGNATTTLSGGVPPVYVTPANSQIGDVLYGPDGVPLGVADPTGKLLMNFNGITVPGAPTGVALTPIAGGVLAAFTPSATLGGTVGTGYEVTLSNGRVQRGAASPIVVNSPAGAVTATVKQINGAGLSVASAASASATVTTYTAPTIPGAPTGLTLTAGSGKVTASWTAAASNGSAIRNTVVTLSNGATATALGSATTVDVFTPNGIAVTATARANNGEGAGPTSAVSNSVAPVDSSEVITNEAARVWQMNTGFTNATSAYNGGGGTITAGGTGTCMVITDFASDCTHIQLIMGNSSTVQPRRVIGFTAVCPDAEGDFRYNALFAAAPVGTFNGGQSFIDVPPRDPSSTSVGLAVSDPYPVTPVLRTDDPSKRRLLAIREAATYPTVGETTNYPVPTVTRSGAGWRNDPAGILMSQGVNGNVLNSAFPSDPWVNGNCTIIGIIFHYKNRASSVFLPGSSLTKNDLNTPSTKKGSGWPMQSTIAASTEERPIEFINGGQAGQLLDKAYICAQEVFRVLKPTHTCIEFANPNNLSAPTTGQIDTLRAGTDQIIALAVANGSRPMLWNGWPRNVGSSPFAAPYYSLAQDNLRKAYLEEMRARGLPYMDTNALMGRGTSPDAIKMIASGDPYDFTVDGLHQSNDGTTYAVTPGFTTFWTTEITNKYWA